MINKAKKFIKILFYSLCIIVILNACKQSSSYIANPQYENTRIFVKNSDILLVSGTMYRNSVELDEWYFLRNGSADYVKGGDYSMQIKNAEENVIAKISLDGGFIMHVEPIGAIPISMSPFAFAVPYPKEVFAVEFVHGKRVMLHIYPTIKLFRDYISLIPDEGFKKDTVSERKELASKVDSIEKSFGDKNFIEMRLRTQELREMIVQKLGEYDTEDTLKIKKKEFLDLVDETLDRINSFEAVMQKTQQ